MANTSNSRILSSLVHALRERIAATPSTPPNNNLSTCADDDALETKFRAVLPNLLNGYVVPSSSGIFPFLPFLLGLHETWGFLLAGFFFWVFSVS